MFYLDGYALLNGRVYVPIVCFQSELLEKRLFEITSLFWNREVQLESLKTFSCSQHALFLFQVPLTVEAVRMEES